jgi:hypothetical protein
MQFLCLAYGSEDDWKALRSDQQSELLKADDVQRQRGDLVAAVGEPTVVQSWEGADHPRNEAFAVGASPLAGFSVVEADSIEEAIRLVERTPCAVAGGAVEVRPFLDLG